MIDEGTNSSDPNIFHKLEEIMHVDVPSSIMHHWIIMFLTMSRTWNANNDHIRGSPLSRSKFMMCKYGGLMEPNALSNSFLWFGHDYITSNMKMETGD